MKSPVFSGELFAGTGMLGRAVGEVFGTRPRWFCEFDAAPSKVLAHHYPDVPNYGDVTKVDFRTVPHTHVRAGGFPCQDVSVSGARAGLRDGTRSGLWSEFARSIAEDRPDWVVIENVGGLLSAEAHSDVEPCPWCLGDGSGEPALRALGAVLADLAALGFDAEWTSIRASDIGAPHGRLRVFILAWPAERTLAADAADERRSLPEGIGWVDSLGRDSDGRGGADEARDGSESPTQPLTLLPTPTVVMNDGESVESWSARRDRVKATGVNGNGMGMPLPIAVQLLPTPTAAIQMKSTRAMTASRANGRRSGGGQSSPLGLEETALLVAGVRPDHVPADRDLPPGSRAVMHALLPTPGAYDGERGGSQHLDKRRNGGHSVTLQDVAEHALMPMPRAEVRCPACDVDPTAPHNGKGDCPPRSNALLPTPEASLGAHRHDYGQPPEVRRAGGHSVSTADAARGISDAGGSWGPYAAAITRWESVMGRPAPSPVRMDGKGGKARLNPELTEWMMGWPAGWVTAAVVGLSRADQLKACGNGVVLHQAVAALRSLLARPGVPRIEWVLAA